jgi:hypothetical protein
MIPISISIINHTDRAQAWAFGKIRDDLLVTGNGKLRPHAAVPAIGEQPPYSKRRLPIRTNRLQEPNSGKPKTKGRAEISAAFFCLKYRSYLKRNPCTSPKTSPASTAHPF